MELFVNQYCTIQEASCIDMSTTFTGNLSIAATSFTNNWQPVAVRCSSNRSYSSSSWRVSIQNVCVLNITDTHFSNNVGGEALAVKLDCGATSSCNVALTRCTFKLHAFAGDEYNATGAVLLVSALDPNTALTLSLTSCEFEYNQGAGLASTSPSGSVLVSNCSFVEQQGSSGGLPALSITGAVSVVINGSRWICNSLGAIALSQVQSSVKLSNTQISGNAMSPLSQSTLDISMLDLSPSSISVTNCSFSNNSGILISPAGAGIYNGASTVIIRGGGNQALLSTINVTIQGSSLASNNGPLMAGALSILTAAQVLVFNTTFSSNQGGAVFLSLVQSTHVQSCTFDANTGQGGNGSSHMGTGGGSVSSSFCNHTLIVNSTFTNNIASKNGGAINAFTDDDDHSRLRIVGCTFRGNRALYGSGGGMFVSGVGNVSVESSTFVACSAAVAGGAVFAVDAPTGFMYVLASSFMSCKVGVLPLGGWLAAGSVAGPSDILSHPQMQGGGCLFVSNRSTLVSGFSTFDMCSSVHSKGGGIRMRACVRVAISSSDFTGCSAAAGGALSVSSMLQGSNSQVGVEGSTFVGNIASTHLPCPGTVCVNIDSTLVGTQGDGGAIAIDSCSLFMYNYNSFTSNTASGRGGAMFAQRPVGGSQLNIVSDVHDNTSFIIPGGFPNVSRYRVFFTNNSALVAGGAIALHGYVLSMEAPLHDLQEAPLYTLFYGNTAPTGEADLWAASMTH